MSSGMGMGWGASWGSCCAPSEGRSSLAIRSWLPDPSEAEEGTYGPEQDSAMAVYACFTQHRNVNLSLEPQEAVSVLWNIPDIVVWCAVVTPPHLLATPTSYRGSKPAASAPQAFAQAVFGLPLGT